jgi:hypothetical protein
MIRSKNKRIKGVDDGLMRVDDFGPLWPKGRRSSQFELEPEVKGAITPWQLACEKALSPGF